MAFAKVRFGPKGQIVVPKLFRDEHGFDPGTEAKIEDTPEGVLIKKETYDIVASMRSIAEKAHKKGVKIDWNKVDWDELYESQFEERQRDLLRR